MDPALFHDAKAEYVYLYSYSALQSECKRLNEKVFSAKEKQSSTLYYMKYFRV